MYQGFLLDCRSCFMCQGFLLDCSSQTHFVDRNVDVYDLRLRFSF